MKSIFQQIPKLIMLLSSSFFISTPALAAKFKVAPKANAAELQSLHKLTNGLIKNTEQFGDASTVSVYSFVRKETERDLSTVKQLNRAVANLSPDGFSAERLQSLTGLELAEYALETLIQADREEDAEFLAKTKSSLAQAFDGLKAKSQFLFFGTSHAAENGAWQVINILDKKNSQILVIKIGFHGT